MLYTSLHSLRSASVRPRSTFLTPHRSITARYSCRQYSTENGEQKKQANTDDVVNKHSPSEASESEATIPLSSSSSTPSGSSASSSAVDIFSLLSAAHSSQKSHPKATQNGSSVSTSLDAGPTGTSREEQLENVKKLIRDWSEKTSYQIRTQADAYTVKAVKTFSQLGAELNKVTGYEEIESLKKRVVAQGMS